MVLVAIAVCTLKYNKSSSEHTHALKAASQQDPGFSKHAIQGLDVNCSSLKSVSHSVFKPMVKFKTVDFLKVVTCLITSI